MGSRLEQAEYHVTRGREIVAAQRERVATLQASGLDDRAAKVLLQEFEDSLVTFETDLQRIRTEELPSES
jgi:hypothetical protein